GIEPVEFRLRCKSKTNCSSDLSPCRRRKISLIATELFASPTWFNASKRTRTFCESEPSCEMTFFQRGSSGSQLLFWRSEAIQISAEPARLSTSHVIAEFNIAGISAAASVGWVKGKCSNV